MVKRRRKITRRRKQKGGYIPTFVGKALNYANLNTYPGVTNHGGNHYAFNKYPVDLQTGNVVDEGDILFKGNLMSGGYIYRKNSSRQRSRSRRRSSRRRYKGGNLPLWGDVRTSFQVAENNIANTHNTLLGKENLVSPLPWRDQYI